MNGDKRALRRRKPLADRTNTIIASTSSSSSSLSSSSSSKPPFSLTKPSKLSLPPAKKHRQDSRNSQNPSNPRLRRCTPIRTGKFPPGSAPNQRQIVEKRKDKGETVSELPEPINTKDPSTSQLIRPQSLHDPGAVGCATRQAADKTKSNGKTVSILLEPINGYGISSSHQRPEALCAHGTINCTTCEPHVVGNPRLTVEKTKEKGKAFLLPYEPILAEDRQLESLHSLVRNQRLTIEKTKEKGKAVLVPHEPNLAEDRQPESLHSLGTVHCATFEPLIVKRHTMEKTKIKEKAASVCLETINAEGPSTSRQEPEFLCGPGAFDCNAFEPLRMESQRQIVEKIEKKGKTVSVPRETVNTEDPSTPQQHPESSHNAGTGDCKVIKSSTVYTRRQPADRWKNVEAAVALPLSCPHPGRYQMINKIGDKLNVAEGDNALPKSFTVPHPRPKKMKRLLPKDFIEQQRAYFAEIDAFELPEEVVSSSDSE